MPLYTDLPIYLIEHPKDLTLHIPSLQEAEELGIDCESDNYYSYQDRLCFIQISTKKALYVLDALKLSDLSALRPIFAKPEVPKYIHGSEYDIVSLKRDFRLKIRGLFDTMIASQILNQNQFGLGALVKNYFGVELDKSLTVSPWDQRPISPEMFDYLINDIRYLIPLGHLLFYHLNKRGYTELASEHFQSLERKNWEKKSFNPGDFIKIKGAKNLNIEQQKRFYTLYRLREKLAKNLNYATFRILSTRELFLLAIHAPETLKKIEKLKLSSLPLSYGEQILEALEEAKNLPKDWVPPPKNSG
jgi:ribonuclease D